MKKSDGYIYLDMMAALSLCLFIVLTLFPLIYQLKLDRQNIVLRAEAQYVLYEKLTAFLDGEIEAIPMEFMQNKQKYTITWRRHEEFPDMMEGCIQYENAVGKTKMVCDATKR